MDSSEKQYSCQSETSSEGSDHIQEKSSDEISGGSRFYECTFCKRGFTNAQALGGHMNIHRREKAKTKPKAKKNAVSTKSQEDEYRGGIPSYYSNYSTDQTPYYSVPYEAQQMNYQYYYPASNPSYPVAYHMMSDYAASQRSDHLGYYEDHRIPNLSLNINGPHHEIAGASMMNGWKENEIDLELHL